MGVLGLNLSLPRSSVMHVQARAFVVCRTTEASATSVTSVTVTMGIRVRTQSLRQLEGPSRRPRRLGGDRRTAAISGVCWGMATCH